MTIPVTVLGAGKIGTLVSYLLTTSGDYDVTLIDSHSATLEKAATKIPKKFSSHLKQHIADFNNGHDLAKTLQNQKFVLSCAPFQYNIDIAKIALQLGVSYLDLTEDISTTHTIKKIAQGAKCAFVPQCGLAPGFISITANHLSQHFDKIESVKMRVGALPIYPHNMLKYNLTWSTIGLINEYGNPCEAIVNKEQVFLQPLEGLETFSYNGLEYEAFNTSGGLGTLCETWKNKVTHLDYKSIRYPGHCEFIKLLMNDLKMNQQRDILLKIFENAIPHTTQDVVIIFVTVTGWKNGLYSQMSYAKKVYNNMIEGQHWGAIQITTAAGICGVLDLLAHATTPYAGFVKQEDIPYTQFIQNRFGKLYEVQENL